MFRRMLDYMETHLDLSLAKEDLRKLGVNFITAGVVGLFITHIADLTNVFIKGAMWAIIIGMIAILLGLYRRNKS